MKAEDALDVWARERSETLIGTNHALKKDAPWAKKKEGREALVDIPASEMRGGNNPHVVSARPGAVNFVEFGVEFNSEKKGWQELNDKSQLSAGDKLRTSRHSFVELMMFPDLYLRLDGESEVLFEQLSNELIAFKVLRGSAILDVARFDRKELPEISIAGPSNSAIVAEDGNYRINARPVTDEIVVRKGKVTVQERSIGGCRIISGGNTTECDRKVFDNFDIWSQHRGEGQFFDGTAMAWPSCAGVVSKPPDFGICIRRKVSTRSCRSSRRIFARRTAAPIRACFRRGALPCFFGSGVLMDQFVVQDRWLFQLDQSLNAN